VNRPNYLPPPQTAVIVGLSGGVDSAVAAIRLLEAGCRVAGLFMSNWDEDDAYCTSAADLQDARAVCNELGIVLHTVNFAAEYRSQVFESFLEEHRRGRTPNPDVLCNREIKFGVAAAHARRLGADCFATGHYARRIDSTEGPQLHKAADQAKDQSYFLHSLDRSQLEQAVFPLGDLLKADVRAIARRAGLAVHDKPDSTGICFIGERPFREFLAEYLPSAPGPIESADGQRLGEHQGLAFYTLGQRGGLQIGGRAGYTEAPWYVAAKIPARNALIVVQQHEHPLLLSSAVETLPMHWLREPREQSLRCSVKLRYRQPDQSAVAERLPQGGLRLRFEIAQRAATPGQYAVLYDAERCLGGAAIDRVIGA
jgi:tRNA-specific 2-thiouridylase